MGDVLRRGIDSQDRFYGQPFVFMGNAMLNIA